MIELNEKTQQDFLNREWVQKLLDAGVDMSDAKYIIGKDKLSMNDDEADLTDYVWYKDSTAEVYDVCPTYSTAELLYKLNEWPSIKLSDDYYIGAPLKLGKDAPFYFAGYYFSYRPVNCQTILMSLGEKDIGDGKLCEEYAEDDRCRKYDIECGSEYPIEALAQLLIASAKSNFHNFKYVEDISSK